ncbi:hypothetical protein GWI33_006862 [Rhynchophorus ferrugineus]|uniref:Uncharacterized protein n=1 Tax=Rhynchophorus ferrugineus TaxID=354439 RepID=A0A834ITV4_RHYFE|nr:hypothetical protein GWI33_006862 [Rhynchophorus ferrugineus]
MAFIVQNEAGNMLHGVLVMRSDGCSCILTHSQRNEGKGRIARPSLILYVDAKRAGVPIPMATSVEIFASQYQTAIASSITDGGSFTQSPLLFLDPDGLVKERTVAWSTDGDDIRCVRPMHRGDHRTISDHLFDVDSMGNAAVATGEEDEEVAG